MTWRFLTLITVVGALMPAAFGQYTISVVAGGGPANGAIATSIALSSVNGTAVDSSGNLYLSSQNRVFMVTTNGIISTVAGTGISGYSGDNAPATSAQLNSPNGLAVDGGGNLYIADSGNYRIRKVSNGFITTVAGNGNYGFSGDFGSATSAQISNAVGVAVDGAGNLYIADRGNYRIRKVSGGMITTVAGTGTFGYSGDGGPATNAQISYPYGIAADGAGNIYFSDVNNYRIRRISGGVITTVAGTGVYGFSGDSGFAASAQISYASGVATDSLGNLYFADSGNYRIRKVSGGVITTVAGTGTSGYSGDLGPAVNAQIGYASAIAVDGGGNLYLADNSRVRKVSGGVINTIAGNGTYGYSGDSGPATSAQVVPAGVAVDGAGTLYIADSSDNRIRKVSGGNITTIVGTGTAGYSGDNGPETSAQVSSPGGVAVDNLGSLYIADSGNSRVRKVLSGIITTVAGNGSYGFSGDNGPATSAEIVPSAIAADGAGNLYIADYSRVRKVAGGVITTVAGGGPADGSLATAISIQSANTAADSAGNVYISSAGENRVFKIATNGTISTVAGTGAPGYSGDNGLATNAQINNPYGIAVDSTGSLYIADAGNARIRKVAGGIITTVAGGTYGFSGDNGPATSAAMSNPFGVTVDGGGNLYIADSGNYRIRKVSGGVITTIAGNGSYAFSGDGGPATSAGIGYPYGIAADIAGNVYIPDSNNNRIRKVSGGIITTVAGNGTYGFSGDNGPATSAEIGSAQSVAVDSLGNLYIADNGNARIRKVSGGVITTVVGNGTYGFSGDNGPATSAQLGYPNGISIDGAGNLYIADTGNYHIRKVSGGVISTIAGNGSQSYSGDGGPATNAQLSFASALAVDNSGSLYISDSSNNRVRVVSSGGTITTFAGGGTQGLAEGLQATQASLPSPGGIALDSAHNLYVVDHGDRLLRKVSAGSGIITSITTIAGQGSYPFPGDGGVAVDSAGKIYLGDPTNGRVLLLTPDTSTTTVVGAINPEPSLVGQAYSVSYTVTTNGGTATGNVNVTDGVAINTCTVAAGTCSITSSSAGLKTITVTYAGDGTYTSSFGTKTHTVYSAQPISVGPASGSSGRQVFTFIARDASGANNIKYAQFLFSKSGISASNACYVSYDPAANVFYLLSDDMTQWYGLLGGSVNTVGNAQCTIYGSTSGSTKSGTDLTTHVDISFRTGFAGSKNVYMYSGDNVGAGSGWQLLGTWNDAGDPSVVELVSLAPNFGTGVSHVFTAVIKDGDGATTIPFVQFVMNNGLNGFNGCFIHYDRASSVFYLLNDAGTAFAGLVAGSATQVSNSQCTLHGVGSGGTVAGSNLTVNYNLDFSAGFAGAKQIFMWAPDNKGTIENWHQLGTWTR